MSVCVCRAEAARAAATAAAPVAPASPPTNYGDSDGEDTKRNGKKKVSGTYAQVHELVIGSAHVLWHWMLRCDMPVHVGMRKAWPGAVRVGAMMHRCCVEAWVGEGAMTCTSGQGS